jgi:hypothetical protein
LAGYRYTLKYALKLTLQFNLLLAEKSVRISPQSYANTNSRAISQKEDFLVSNIWILK